MRMTLSDYLALFPGASRDKPRFAALAEAVLRQAADLIPLAAQLQSGFSFAWAEGVQLDCIAEAVGLRRSGPGTGVTDETFRQYLLAKLALWTWDGTNETVPAVLAIALPGSTQADNGDGTVTVTTGGTLPAEAGELFPVPAGVRIIQNEGGDT